jgi:type I restriction enzyme S subunit
MENLYQLPDGWEWKKLDEVGRLFSGSSAPQKDEYFIDGKYPFIRTKDLATFGRTNNLTTVNDYINDKCTIDSKLVLANRGTILFPKSGASIGTNNRAMIGFDSYIVSHLGAFYNKEEVTNKYVYNYFLTIDLLDYCENPSYPSLKISRVKNIEIPFPPLSEQQRIVSKLDLLFEKIDKVIALHQKNIDEVNVFMGSVLNEVFKELEEKYATIPLFEVADVSRGKSKHRPRNDKKLFGGNYPFIQTGDVRNANKYITDYTNTYSEFGLAQSKLWKKGTICMTIAANIGDVAILNMDSCFPDSVVGLYSENNSNDYLYFFLQTLKQHLESKATTTAQMNINLKVLQTIGVPLPPLSIQEQIVKYLNNMYEKIEKIKSIQKEKMDSIKALKASILDSAFRGEL